MIDCAACASSASRPQPSCVKLTCVINTDHVGISHVTGSSYFVRALHEVVNIMVRDALLGICAVPCICVACVEKCVLCV